MNKITMGNQAYNTMLMAIEEIYEEALKFPWENENIYANWLAQSFFYVQWTTRQLALASAKSKPIVEDLYHWRFIEEAKEEKKHEQLVLHDLKNLGYSIDQFKELPHASFFYQTLTYMIENEHPISILGYSLTLEGFAALKADKFYPRVKAKYGTEATTFMRLHCELDQDHFQKALPYLQSCPEHLIPYIIKGIEQCKEIYIGILNDVLKFDKQNVNFSLSQNKDLNAI